MTRTRSGDAFLPADEYGRSLPKFSVNLLVRSVGYSLPFYRDVLGATVRYADDDFAALSLLGVDFMLHADHAYDHHPLYAPLQAARERPRFFFPFLCRFGGSQSHRANPGARLGWFLLSNNPQDRL